MTSHSNELYFFISHHCLGMQSMQKEDLRFKALEKCYEDRLESVINHLVHHKAAFAYSTKGQYTVIGHKAKMFLHL